MASDMWKLRSSRRQIPAIRLQLEQLDARELWAVITVTSPLDTVANDSQVTLREAILAAETDTSVDGSAAGSGADTIVFDPALAGKIITLTTAGSDSAGPSAFAISSNITIAGFTGPNGVTLAGLGADSNLRAFYVSPTGSLTLQNLTLQNFRHRGGDGNIGGGAAGMGGAVFVHGGSLTVDSSSFVANTAQGGTGQGGQGHHGGGGLGGFNDLVGGGIDGTSRFDGGGPNRGSGGAGQGGTTTFDGGSPDGGFGGGGGGGWNGFVGGAGGFGGGGGGGSGFKSFTAGGPGGFGGGGGGGGSLEGTSLTSFDGGSPRPTGAGGYLVGGPAVPGGFGGGASGNAYGGGGAGLGGAIFATDGTVTIVNSTFVDNRSIGGAGANPGQGLGGAVFVRNGTLDVTFATLTGNTAADGGGAVFAVSDADSGTGFSAGTATVSIRNSILAENTGTDLGTTAINGAAAPSVTQSSNLIGGNPLLGPLGRYGGPTPVRPPLAGSPALGTATPLGTVTTDQYAATRPGTPDIGAVQALATPVTSTVPVNLSFTANAAGDLGTTLKPVGEGRSITLTATAAAPVVGDQTVTVGGLMELYYRSLAVAENGYDTATPGTFTLGSGGVITIPDGQTTGSITVTFPADLNAQILQTATLYAGDLSAGLTLGASATVKLFVIETLVTPPVGRPGDLPPTDANALRVLRDVGEGGLAFGWPVGRNPAPAIGANWPGVSASDGRVDSIVADAGLNTLRAPLPPATLAILTGMRDYNVRGSYYGPGWKLSMFDQVAPLSALTRLRLDDNAFEGRLIDTFPDVGRTILPNLFSFNMSATGVSGPLPSIRNSASTLIRLTDTRLDGDLPPDWTVFNRDLSRSQLTGDPARTSLVNGATNPPAGSNQLTDAFVIRPTGVAVTAGPGPDAATLTWNAAPGGLGYFEVFGAANPGGPYAPLGRTADLSATSLAVTVPAGVDWFVVRRITQGRFDVTGPASAEVSLFRTATPSFVVTTLADVSDLTDGVTSLREAVAFANAAPGANTVTFAPGLAGGTVTLTNGPLELTDPSRTTLDAGSLGITVSGGGESQVFVVATGATATLNGLTVADGFTETYGGAIDVRGDLTFTGGTIHNSEARLGGGMLIAAGATVLLDRVTMSGNTARDDGGGIYNVGTLTVRASTLSGNTAGRDGGAIFNQFTRNANGGTIGALGTVTLTTSTLAGNTATRDGGAVYNRGALTADSVTVADNTAGNGGGLFSDTSIGGTTAVAGSIVARNTGSQADIAGTVIDGGFNLVANAASAGGLTNGVNGNLVGVDPALATLANNGGPTQTIALLLSSPAIDAGDPASTRLTDQRGFARFASPADIGAFEFGATPLPAALVVTTLDDEDDPGYDPADLSLREAVRLANLSSDPNSITFAPALVAAGDVSLTLSLIGDGTAGPSALAVTTPIVIEGPTGDNGVTLAGGGAASNLRAFYVGPTGDLTLRTLTVRDFRHKGGDSGVGGGAAGLGGAIFVDRGTLTADRVTFAGNTAQGGRGGGGGGDGGGDLGGNGGAGLGGGPNGGAHNGGVGGFGGGGGGGNFGGSGGFGGGGGYGGGGRGGSGGFGGGGGYPFGIGGFGGGRGGDSGGGGGAGMGGAVFANGGTVTLLTSTLAGNTAAGGTVNIDDSVANTGQGLGGAVFVRNGTLTITNSTLAGNTAADGGRQVYILGDSVVTGGDPVTATASTATITGSILAGADTSVTDFVGNTNGTGTQTADGSNNLVRSATGFAGTGTLTADPRLAPLGDYGGPTPTLALLAGSPAVDAATGTGSDQRGVTLQGSARDLGAFESRGFTIAATNGTSQSTDAGTPFTDPLEVTVTSLDTGVPVDGLTVTYFVPGSGASAGLSSMTATTAADGTASVTSTAGLTAGSYQVTATVPGVTGTAVFSLTNDPLLQTITFGPLAPVTYGVSPITLAATGGGSGNPVTFSIISGPGDLLGNVLTVTGVGEILIEANQSGNETYTAAQPVQRTLTVNPALLTVTGDSATRAFGQPNPPLTATFSGFVNGETLATSGVTGVPTITTLADINSPVGDYPVTPTLGSLSAVNYSFQFVPGTLTVGRAEQSITFPSPFPIGFATGVSVPLAATASSGLPVTYVVVSGPGELVGGSVVRATGPGAVVVRATQPGDTMFGAAEPVEVAIVFRPVGSSAFPLFTTSGDQVGVSVQQPGEPANEVPGTGPGSRAVVADVTGDGVADTILASAPGARVTVTLLDGVTGNVIRTLGAFEDTFRDSATLAAGDVNGDGIADIAVGADAFGGPRVTVFDGATGSVLADFYGIDDPDFRGGVRVALGDVDGDGLADLAVAAGVGGGPRIALWDGASLRPGSTPTRLVDDFFCFEPTLRDGANVTLGDVNGDGKADLVLSGGPGGSPRVLVWDAADFLASNGTARTVLANFFAGDESLTLGARVAAKDLDGDLFADLVVGIPTGPATSLVRTYLGKDLSPTGTPPVFEELSLDTGGVFVG